MIKFIQGDCLTTMPGLEAHSIDVLMTSPPYNLGIKYRSGIDDARPRDEYLAWTKRWLVQAYRVLAPAGSLFLNLGGKPSDPYVPFEVAADCVRQSGFILQNVIYWMKSASFDGGPVQGHAKPINSPRYVTDTVEHLFHLTKSGEVPVDKLALGVEFADKSNLTRGGRGKNGDKRDRGNVWMLAPNAIFAPYQTIQSRDKDRPHPASYPPELAAFAFKFHGLSRIKNTLDPFSGLGSTARAAKVLGINHVGIELSAEDIADAQRLLAEVPEPQAATA